MTANFTFLDLIANSTAFFLFPLFIFIPGYVFGWLSDVFGFRKRSLLARFAISTPLSIAVFPIFTYLLWHWSVVAVWVMYGACWIGFLTLLFHDRHIWLSGLAISKTAGILLAIIAGWVVLGMFCLIDMQIGNRLYFPSAAHDYTLRVAFVSSITRTGIPPHNPYFFPGRPLTLRYHYFWFILCSLVDQLGGALVSPRQAMLASILWAGIGLIAVVPLYLRFFQPKGPVNIERRTLLGVALLSVTGLDILPVILFAWLTPLGLLPTIEWWNNHIAAWTHAILWVPHHIAGLISCLTGFLVIWYVVRAPGSRNVILAGVIAGLAFASAVGLSIYVTFVFTFFLAIWLIITLFKRNLREAAAICSAGVIALAASAPYLWELLEAGSGQRSGGGPFVQLTIRWFSIAEALTLIIWPNGPAWREPLANAILLPLNYYLELGFLFKVGLVQWKRMRRGGDFFSQKELCGFTMAVTSIMICTFLTSGTISGNDLGWRGFMVAQFMLLIWGAELCDEGFLAFSGRVGPEQRTTMFGDNRRGVLIALIVLGVCGTLYEVCMFRFFPLITDEFPIRRYRYLAPDHKLGKRTYALRQTYEALRTKLPEHAIVQHNPNAVPGDLFFGLYGDRQAAAETAKCGVVFGGDPALCNGIISPINDLFEKPGAIGVDRIDAVCKTLSIDALVVKDTDKVWADKSGWVWKTQPVIANDYARAFLCGRGDAK
jgi:hypothetical protein